MAGAFLLILYCQNFQFAHNCGHMGTMFAEHGLGCQLGENQINQELCVLGWGAQLAYLSCRKSWVHSPVQHKPAVVA